MKPTILVQALREGGNTERLHTVPHHQEASVAKHSWNMVMLLRVLKPDASLNLIWACLLHDIAERWVGDTPAPAKYSIHPPLHKELHAAESKVEAALGIRWALTPEEGRWFKAVDNLEFMLFAEDELALGNRHMEVALRNVKNLLDDDWVPAEVRAFVESYRWCRTSDIINGDTMEKLSHEQHTTR